jgi:hypothetical protein
MSQVVEYLPEFKPQYLKKKNPFSSSLANRFLDQGARQTRTQVTGRDGRLRFPQKHCGSQPSPLLVLFCFISITVRSVSFI